MYLISKKYNIQRNVLNFFLRIIIVLICYFMLVGLYSVNASELFIKKDVVYVVGNGVNKVNCMHNKSTITFDGEFERHEEIREYSKKRKQLSEKFWKKSKKLTKSKSRLSSFMEPFIPYISFSIFVTFFIKMLKNK